ncbi:hypothetical protein [Phenylobacterium sp.]|jgi:hypothetical protein|uniref:hypothetical protein n=1 Tax=Phenylobacterium sp. TaxID=1871053 RepID=UPI002F4122BA
MDLIERYLAAIGRQLPATQAGDILGELREELLSRQEEREAALGRPLTRQDVEALLLEFGHPLVVAARYRKTQQLIGPEVFPFWLTTIQWSLAILAIVWVVLTAIGVLLGKTQADARHAAPDLIPTALTVFGAITLAFAAFERFGKAGFLRDWKPSRLPPPDRATRPRAGIVAEIAVDVGFIAWWQGLIRFQDFFPYPVHLQVALAPVWAAWHWPILAYAIFGIAADLVALARPAWVRTNTGLRVGRYLYGVAILVEVFRAGHWVEVGSPLISPGVLSIIQTNFDLGMRVGIGVAILGMLLQVGLDLRRGYRQRQAQPDVAAKA